MFIVYLFHLVIRIPTWGHGSPTQSKICSQSPVKKNDQLLLRPLISSAFPKVLGQMKTSDILTQLDGKEIDQSGKSGQCLLAFLVTFLHCLKCFSHISLEVLPNRFVKHPSLSAACGAFSQACVGWNMSLRLLSEPTKQRGTTWILGFRITVDGRNEVEPLWGGQNTAIHGKVTTSTECTIVHQ